MEAPTYQRLRMTFAKNGPARWTGHLDVSRTWERALNRAKIPMAYTQGFNRRPRMQFASALPLGYTSRCELVDLWLREAMTPEDALAQVKAKMAPGIDVMDAREIVNKQPALPTLTLEAFYDVELTYVDISAETLQQKIDTFLAEETVEWEKAGRKNKGKFYNMRPLVLGLELVDAMPLGLKLHVKSIEGQNGRPGHILGGLGIDHLDAKVERSAFVLSEKAYA